MENGRTEDKKIKRSFQEIQQHLIERVPGKDNRENKGMTITYKGKKIPKPKTSIYLLLHTMNEKDQEYTGASI